ncbi:MAG: glycoside hydrolase family 2 TIM barrel-domain containing protein [Rikenellaceae bacterium]
MIRFGISCRALLLSVAALLTATLSQGEAFGREKYNLNSDWRIFSSAENSGDKARTVSLPYCMDISPDTPISQSIANYVRIIHAPAEWRSRRVYIKFNGVQSIGDLFVNGHYIGSHRGGATAFVFELTKHLQFEEDNTLFMRVSASPLNDLLPTSVEHVIYGGIYRDVEIITTPRSAFSTDSYGADGIFVTTKSIDGGVAKGDVALYFSSETPVERRVDVEFIDDSGAVVFERSYAKAKVDERTPLVVPFEVASAKLWSPQSPNLYTVRARMSSVDGGDSEVVAFRDSLSVVTGLRTIELAKDGSMKGMVKINGEAVQMRGVTVFHDHPDIGRSLSRKHYDKVFEDMRDLGANAVRSAVVPHDKHFYELCDQLGVLAWVDTPLSRAPYLSDVAYFPTKAFQDNGMQQLREIIYQNYNHPSIAMWGLFSMLLSSGDDATDFIRKLHAEAKKIDVTRPTVALSNQNGDKNSVPDLIVWRQDIGWNRGYFTDIDVWQEQLHSRWTNFRSAVMYGDEGNISHQADRRAVVRQRTNSREGWFPEVRQSIQHETYSRALAKDSLFWGVWLSALYDYRAPRSATGMSNNGVVAYDRAQKKDAYHLYRAQWNNDAKTLHIADKRNNLLATPTTSLIVYASDDGGATPMVYINGDTLSMRRTSPSQFKLDSVRVAQPANRVNVVVHHNDLRDSVTLIYNSPLRARE